MSKLKIQREEHGKKGAFFVEKDETWIAEMTYTREGTRTLVIDHTEIAKPLRGKGIGKAMVKAAVKYAEKNNLLIKTGLSVCQKGSRIFRRIRGHFSQIKCPPKESPRRAIQTPRRSSGHFSTAQIAGDTNLF